MLIKLNKEEKKLKEKKKDTRDHLDHTKQPKRGWRTIPFNGYYEAHPSGLIRNKHSKKLIKGTKTRKYSKFCSHEIVYLLLPNKTSYTRARIIATTFPEKVSQSKGNLKNGYVCFKDGNRENCNVKNLFIGSGKTVNYVYKVNNSYLTSKDIAEYVNTLTKENISNQILSMLNSKEQIKKTKQETIIMKKGNTFSILKNDSSLYSFTVESKAIKGGK